jgi:hypothetical protein
MEDDPGAEMETVLEAIERVRAAGYSREWSATDNGRLRCGECHEVLDAAQVSIDETVRFEGASDPDDEVILFAIAGPCGHRGYYLTAYGPDTPPSDVTVLQALTRR